MAEYISEKLSNGNTINYKVIDGTAYHVSTNDRIVELLERARKEHARVRFSLGDTETGRDWNDTLGTCGYIGRSTGSIKVPLLLKNSRSTGGGALLDQCIIRLEYKGHRDKSYYLAYQHERYHKEQEI